VAWSAEKRCTEVLDWAADRSEFFEQNKAGHI
jgi:hypothetical protein